eukprot:TRINITY_DN21886_c0_g4_i2.p2 TRINITY_DN21886_c0_g4~~TRINITY_DN21886_c0_g4_i2.p2  ORF type:complete len:311 (-),score=50.69 TRINITY_DN21886_c0_g4_i2:89-1021(-)
MEQRSVTSAFHNEGGGSRLAGAFGAGSRSETWDRSGTGALLTRPLAQPRTRPHRSTLPLESPALAAGRVPSLDDALALALRRRGVPSRVRDTLPLAAASGARSNRAGRGVSAATVGAFRPSNFSMLEALPEPTVSVFDVNGDGSANGARGGSLLRPAASAAVASQTSEPFVPLAAQTPAVSSAAPARGLRPSAPARGALAVAPTSSDLEPLPEPNVTAFDIGEDGEPPLDAAPPTATALAVAEQLLASVGAAAPLDASCAVCLESLLKTSMGGSEEPCGKLPCGHCFHRSCALPWLALRGTCPTCRAKFT